MPALMGVDVLLIYDFTTAINKDYSTASWELRNITIQDISKGEGENDKFNDSFLNGNMN